MQQNTRQYLKYKDKFKKQGIISIAASACMLLTMVLFIFLPCFGISVVGDAETEELTYHFSLYDEIAKSFENLFSEQGLYMTLLSFYQVMAIVVIAIGGFTLIKDLIVSVMNAINLDNYALTEYDKIKSRQEQGNKRSFRRTNSIEYFFAGIALEITAIFWARSMISGNKWTGPIENIPSYLAYMNLTTAGLYIVVIFFVISVGLIAVKSYFAKTIKLQILKEDYDLPEQEAQKNEIGNHDENNSLD